MEKHNPRADVATAFRRGVVAACLISALAVSPTAADVREVSDPSGDTPGLLDIRSAAHRHGQQRLIVHALSTYDEWDAATLDGNSRIFWYFRVDGSLRRTAITRAAPDGSLFTEVFRGPTNDLRGFAKTWRPDNHSVQIAFPRRLLGRGASTYSWYVQTIFHRSDHPDCGDEGGDVSNDCLDRAPDRGWVRHSIGG